MGKAPASSILEDRNPQTVLFNPTGAEQALISNRGGRSGDPLCFTLHFRGRATFRRSLSKPILRCKHESSPRTVSTGGSPLEKGANNIILATRECSLGTISPRENRFRRGPVP